MEMSNTFKQEYKKACEEINEIIAVKHNIYEQYFKMIDDLSSNSITNDIENYSEFEGDFLDFACNNEILINTDEFMTFFENIIFQNGEIKKNIDTSDSIYIFMFFSYLSTIYKKFQRANNKFSITDKGLNENEILKKLNKIRKMNKKGKDILPYVDEVNQLLAIKSNLFSKKMINNYLRLYYFIVENNFKNNKHISVEELSELIVNLLCDYEMKEELFDLIAKCPINLINSKMIKLIYDDNSARFIYNSLNNMVLSVNKLNKMIISMFERILSILSKSKCDDIINAYNKYKNIKIKNFELDDKIYIMSMLETDVFWSLKVNGIYNNFYGLFGNYMSFDTDRRIKYGTTNLFNIYNQLNIDYDVFSEDFIRLLDGVMTEKKLDEKYIDAVDILLIHAESATIMFNMETKFMLLKNKVGTSLMPSDKVKNAFTNTFDEIPIHIIKRSERIKVDVFYDLRFIYNEMIGFFNKLLKDYFNIKAMINDFNNISNIDELLDSSREILENYELSDVLNNSSNILINENYDSEKASQYLYIDLKALGIVNLEDKFNEILNYTKVKKTLLSAANFWYVYAKTQNLNIDKDGQEYTPIVANYFKAVEILLYRKIKDKYIQLSNDGINLLQPFTANGKTVDFTKNDELTLGEMAKYIRREKRIVNDKYDNLFLYEKLRNWISNVRNSNFHTDLILTKSQAEFYKNESLLIICDILDYL